MMLYLTFGLISLILKKKSLIKNLNIFYILFFIFFLNSEYGKDLSISAFYSGLYSFSIGCLFFFIFKKINNFYNSTIYRDIIFYILVLIFLFEIFYFDLIKQNIYILFYSVVYFSIHVF